MDVLRKKRGGNKEKTVHGNMKAYLTVSEAARYLSVCCKTIRCWDKAGKITCVRTLGNHRSIPIIEIKRVSCRIRGKFFLD
ncbi:MAG: excisionase family DNA-binding protein [Candidatus Hodarchaeales archaeon]